MLFRVWMHTSPSPGATYYKGFVDAHADDPEQAIERAKREVVRRALHAYSALRVDRVEVREC